MSENMKDETAELVSFGWRGNTRRMYPEVATFLGEYAKAQWAREDAMAEADHIAHREETKAYREASMEGRSFDTYSNNADRQRRDAWRTAQRTARAEAERVYSQERERLQSLLINSPHKEVAWIGREIVAQNPWDSEVGGYARDILAILPATTEQIWAEAKDNRGMCDVFDRYYDQAEAAGIFNTNGSVVAAREIAAVRSWVRRNLGGSYASQVMPYIDRVVKAVQEDADKRLAEAKAEWQRLDEARAENATFNRSQAQKARYERERAAREEQAKAVVEDDQPDSRNEFMELVPTASTA